MATKHLLVRGRMHGDRPEEVPASLGSLYGACLGFDSLAGRQACIRRLSALGYNHFVCYCDVNAEFALSIGWAAWATYPHVVR